MFIDRIDAGRLLAARLSHYAGVPNACILALPRGGVPVGFQVAQALNVPFDIFIVRKLGLPGHEELAMGAIASGGMMVLNEDVIRHARISKAEFQEVVAREKLELDRREREYRSGRPPLPVSGRICILVDDGIATGASMLAAARALRAANAKSIVVAAPVASAAVFEQFAAVADDIVCVITPDDFSSVGAWYGDFSQTTDLEVASYLNSGSRPSVFPAAGADSNAPQ